MNGTLLCDFDSTLIQTETLEVLAEVISADNLALKTQIETLTNRAMSGELDFHEALQARITLLKPTAKQIQDTTALLATQITPSFLKHKAYIQENADHIYIVSGGFREMITPIAAAFGIHHSHVFANDFCYENGIALRADPDNLMAYTDGKLRLIQRQAFPGPITMLGDGMSDAMCAQDANTTFIAFGENVRREAVRRVGAQMVNGFEAVIQHLER